MKLASFQVRTPVGMFTRVGALRGGHLVDLNMAYTRWLADENEAQPHRLAAARGRVWAGAGRGPGAGLHWAGDGSAAALLGLARRTEPATLVVAMVVIALDLDLDGRLHPELGPLERAAGERDAERRSEHRSRLHGCLLCEDHGDAAAEAAHRTSKSGA